ncbi:MAG: hypothetical protein VXZ91_01540 [Pseudomonadota bacterium]|nr:hypothetical protein [Pseudomonadota bacterium]
MSNLFAAEEEVLLLLRDDRIGLQASEDTEPSTEGLIKRYYELLAVPTQKRLTALQMQLANRMEDYEVAFAAADTAELNEIYADLSRYWAEIQLIHYQEYTSAAMGELQTAYAALYGLIAGFN